MLTTILWGVGGVVVMVVAATAAWAGLRAAPFLPTRQRDVERLIAAAHIQAHDRVVDLGAGDGRLVLAAAQQTGAQAIGYEISFLPFLVARWRLWRSKLGSRARIEMKDFFSVPLSSFDVVVCFLTPGPMQRLRTKLEHELKPGTRVVSYVFPITGWEPERVDKPNDTELSIFVYRKPG